MALPEIRLDPAFLERYRECFEKAAYLAFQDLRIKVDQDQTVPFLNSPLSASCHVYVDGDVVKIAWNTPYAAFQYFTPGLNHYLGQHANATDHWMEKYLTGDERDYIKRRFEHHLENELRRAGYLT